MRKVTKEVIKQCADNLLFEISDENIEQLVEDFDALLVQVDFLKHIENIDNLPMMSYPYEVVNSTLREDTPLKPLNTNMVLKNSANPERKFVKVSKVIGE